MIEVLLLFSDIVLDCGLEDAGFYGNHYTWTNGQIMNQTLSIRKAFGNRRLVHVGCVRGATIPDTFMR